MNENIFFVSFTTISFVHDSRKSIYKNYEHSKKKKKTKEREKIFTLFGFLLIFVDVILLNLQILINFHLIFILIH